MESDSCEIEGCLEKWYCEISISMLHFTRNATRNILYAIFVMKHDSESYLPLLSKSPIGRRFTVLSMWNHVESSTFFLELIKPLTLLGHHLRTASNEVNRHTNDVLQYQWIPNMHKSP